MKGEEPVRPDRLNAFSDGVFAVIITILVLEFARRMRQTSRLFCRNSRQGSATSSSRSWYGETRSWYGETSRICSPFRCCQTSARVS